MAEWLNFATRQSLFGNFVCNRMVSSTTLWSALTLHQCRCHCWSCSNNCPVSAKCSPAPLSTPLPLTLQKSCAAFCRTAPRPELAAAISWPSLLCGRKVTEAVVQQRLTPRTWDKETECLNKCFCSNLPIRFRTLCLVLQMMKNGGLVSVLKACTFKGGWGGLAKCSQNIANVGVR